MTTTDPLLARLTAADPVPAAPVLPAGVVAAEADALLAVPRHASRRRGRRRTAALAALAVLVAVPAGAAAVDLAGLHTGLFPGAGDTESVAGEEYLDTSAPAVAAVVRDLTRGVPLPPRAGWDPLLDRFPAREGGLMQRSGLGAQVEWYARCRWLEAWLAADRAGDAEAAAASAEVLREAATWPATAATDGGGVVAALRASAAAAAAGESGPVRALHSANCG